MEVKKTTKNPVVIGCGRMNPPTIGHRKLIDTMADAAKKYNAPAKLYLSHTQDDLRNPLSYESKIQWADKAFGDKVEIVNTPDKTLFAILAHLYEDGYTDIIYVGGGDRIGGEGDITSQITKYNGIPNKKGEVIYDFDTINFISAGDRIEGSDDLAEKASASLVRATVVNNNFKGFKQLVPFNEKDADRLFREIHDIMVGGELPKDLNTLVATEEDINESYYGNEDNEFISYEDLELYEDISDRETLKQLVKKIRPYFKDKLEKAGNGQITIAIDSKHPYEILRVGNNISAGGKQSEEDLKELVEDVFKYSIKGNFYPFGNNQSFVLVDMDDYSIHRGDMSSGTYNSYRITGRLISNDDKTSLSSMYGTDAGEEFYLYLAIKGGKHSNKKLFTPNRVLDLIDGKMAVSQIPNKINSSAFTNNPDMLQLLKSLFTEAVISDNITPDADLSLGINYIKGEGENPGPITIIFDAPESAEIYNNLNLDKDVKASIAQTIYTDLTEVLGAAVIGTAIEMFSGNKSYVEFPSSSREPIIDYIIYDNSSVPIKVSAKNGEGGKPSISGLVNTIINNRNIYQGNDTKEFLSWFNEAHLKPNVSQSHRNVADKTAQLIVNGTSNWEKKLRSLIGGNAQTISDLYSKIMSTENIPLVKMSIAERESLLAKLKDEINKALSSIKNNSTNPGYKISNIDKLYPSGDINKIKFIPNKAVFCMCKLFVNLINAGDLVNNLNRLFSDSFGKFIQVYCTKHDMSTGSFTFKLVFTSCEGEALPVGETSTQYVFIEDCANSVPDGRMIQKRISMSLKH